MNRLITENLATWTAAPNGIKKLRELILELAVRGLLVPQDPNDEPAGVLLDKIAAEKARLVNEGKMKPPKPLPKISESEKPFVLPKGWEWVRLDDIGHDWGQKIPKSEFTYIDVGAINKELGLIENPQIIQSENAPSRARKIVKKGTVIYSTVRPYLLNIAIVDDDFFPEPIASTAFAIIHPYSGISASFVYRYLRSPSFINYVESCQTGIAYPAVNDKQFFSGLIPLPPELEQHRIVAKVDELMQLCDQLEQKQTHRQQTHRQLVSTLLTTLTEARDAQAFQAAWSRIAANFEPLFTTVASVEQLQQTVLQLAVMGKLVPQNPANEPAAALLTKIAEEKVRLIAEGKIKPSKPLPKIGESEKPFVLPDGWEWARISVFTQVGTGSTPSRTNPLYYSPAQISWVTSGETQQNFIFDTREKISPLAVKETNVSVYPIGSLIVAMYGQGKTRGQVSELMIEAGTNQACAVIQFIEQSEAHRKYIKLFFKKAYEELRSHSAGGAQPNLNVGKISSTVIPLPPLAEQHRIVAKVDELMHLCEQLKTKLQTAQTLQQQLAQTLVQKAIA